MPVLMTLNREPKALSTHMLRGDSSKWFEFPYTCISFEGIPDPVHTFAELEVFCLEFGRYNDEVLSGYRFWDFTFRVWSFGAWG